MEQNKPDGLWYTEQDRAYGRSGGTTSFDKCGSSYLTLTGTTVDGGWGLGAIPDAFWWNNEYRDYALAGVRTKEQSKCGGSCLTLDSPVGRWAWDVGAK